MENRNTHLAPGFTLNDLAPAPANVAVFWGLLGPGGFNSLHQMCFQQWSRFSLCGLRTSRTPLCSCGLALPTRAPPGIELWSCKLCAPLVYIILTEFKPSPFSFFSSVPAAVSTFLLSLQLLLGGWCFSRILPPPVSVLSPHAKTAPCVRGFSLPKFTSPCRGPAEFCGSGCADCCVNPQISFLVCRMV